MTSLLSLITPINLEAEREKFMASDSYNPTFRYRWQDEVIEPIFKNIAKYEVWEAIENQDHEAIVKAASKFFEVNISKKELSVAQEAARGSGAVSHGSAEEYANQMRDALSHFDIRDIQVVLSDQAGFNARPNHHQKTIFISKHVHFDYFSIEGSVRHEMAHVIRHRNGKYNQIERSNNYLPTEEGLTSWCQDNTNDDNGLAQHAMEYVASSVGVRGSLRDVYNAFREMGMSVELAWKRGCRHKFGFVDTTKPGDILKPAMYFANELKIEKLTTEEKLRLFVGKIALNELVNYPTYLGNWPAEKVADYFKL